MDTRTEDAELGANSTTVLTVLTNISISTWNQTVENECREHLKYEQFYLRAQFATGLICYPIVCVFGLTGNILSVIVLGQKKMRTSTNIYLLCLAVSDSIKLLNDLLYFLTILFLQVNPYTGNLMYGHLYPYSHFVMNWSIFTTAWLTLSVGVERYILVCHAPQAKVICSKSRSLTTCVLVFLLMTVLALPSAFRYRTIQIHDNATSTHLDVELTDLWKNNTFATTYTWIQNLLRSIIPLFILSVLNTFIVHALWRTRTKRRMTAKNRITVTLIFVVLVFLICVTPDAIMSTFFGFGYSEANYLVRGIREITDLLLAVNSACNFILYCTFNRMFRTQFMVLFINGPSKRVVEDSAMNYALSYSRAAGVSLFQNKCAVSSQGRNGFTRLAPEDCPDDTTENMPVKKRLNRLTSDVLEEVDNGTQSNALLNRSPCSKYEDGIKVSHNVLTNVTQPERAGDTLTSHNELPKLTSTDNGDGIIVSLNGFTNVTSTDRIDDYDRAVSQNGFANVTSTERVDNTLKSHNGFPKLSPTERRENTVTSQNGFTKRTPTSV